MRFRKAVAVVLAGSLLAGCASREVYFTSTPFGAEVHVGNRQGITPCTLKVPEGVGQATFTLSGEEQTLPVPDLDGDLDDVAEFGGKALGGTIMVIGGSVALLGFLGILAAAPDRDDDEFDRLRDSNDDKWDGDTAGIGLLMLAGGGLVFMFGNWIYPEDGPPVLHADFGSAN